MSTVTQALVALAAACGLFALVYAVCRRLDNYGFVDVAWSYAFAPLAAFYAIAGSGWAPRRGLLAVMVAGWSLRLGTHLFVRVRRHHPEEDRRYVQLRRDWAGRFHRMMFGFFQLQAASVVLLGLAFLLASQSVEPRFHLIEGVGFLVWLVGLAGESVADAQLAAFKRRPENRGRVCDTGLWRFSRHPNYFFEWLIWVGFGVFALAAPGGVLGLIGPIGILYLLLRVTGVPLAEEQSLRSRGDAYRRYQETTNAFFPGPPKR